MIVTWKIDYNRKISHGRLEQMNTKRDCNYDACSGRKKIAQEKWKKTEKNTTSAQTTRVWVSYYGDYQVVVVE